MANVIKNVGGPQSQGAQPQAAHPQGAQPQAQQPQPQQPQRGELARREPMGVSRDPFQMFMRDPFELMREMMVNPFRMFSMSPWMGRDLSWSPSFEVRETDDAFVLKADLPGVRPDDLEISLMANQLTIRGKREQEKEEGEGQYHTYERSYGTFTRSFALPESADLDKIRSDLKDGELTILVPKQAGSSPQRRKIQIGSGQKS